MVTVDPPRPSALPALPLLPPACQAPTVQSTVPSFHFHHTSASHLFSFAQPPGSRRCLPFHSLKPSYRHPAFSSFSHENFLSLFDDARQRRNQLSFTPLNPPAWYLPALHSFSTLISGFFGRRRCPLKPLSHLDPTLNLVLVVTFRGPRSRQTCQATLSVSQHCHSVDLTVFFLSRLLGERETSRLFDFRQPTKSLSHPALTRAHDHHRRP